MTGKLLGMSRREKPKEPLTESASSDDENRAMLAEEQNYVQESDSCNIRTKCGQGWASNLYNRQLPAWIFQRAILCFLAHFGFVLLYVIRSTMSVAVVQMTSPHLFIVGNTPVVRTEFNWTMQQQGILLGSFFCGYILTQIPGGYFAMKWGGRKVFGGGLFFASIASVFTPVLGHLFGFYGFQAARILCGICEGVTYPAIHAMWNHWAPPKERTTLVSFAFSGAYVGAALTMAQYMNSSSLSSGWENLFYVPGIYAVLWTFIWFSWGAEYPEHDPTISDHEMKHISETVGFPNVNSDLPVPWFKILTCHRVWAISLCHFAANWGFYTILTELPTFLTHALEYKGEELTTYATIPFLAMAISAATGGFLVDITLHRCLNTTMTRKVTVSFTFLAQMTFFFLAGKKNEPFECVLYITGAMLFCGLCWSGFSANHLDIAPDYASILLGVTNTFGTLPGILSPYVIGIFVKDKKDVASWSTVFFYTGFIYLAAAMYYVIFGGGERQDWANASESLKLKSNKKLSNSGDVESGSDQ